MPVFLSIFASVFLLDFITKTLVRARMALNSEIPLLPVFSLVHLKNTGIAFGMFQGRNWLFIGIGVGVIAFMLFYAIRLLREDRFSALVLAGVLGGALGNMVDRVFFGEVTDFLDFFIGAHHWPAFNVADSAICVGAALLIFHGMRRTS